MIDTNEIGNNSFLPNSEQIASTSNVHLAASSPKLPKLQLPKFSGISFGTRLIRQFVVTQVSLT